MKHILYFTADWCNPCKQTRPIVEELNHEQIMAKFFIIDVDLEILGIKEVCIHKYNGLIIFKVNMRLAK